MLLKGISSLYVVIINQSQSYNITSIYRSVPVPPPATVPTTTSNQSLLYKIAFIYCTPVYFSATAALYVLSSICDRFHTDIKINQSPPYKISLTYRPDPVPPLLLFPRVMTNQSIQYKTAFFYCTSRFFSASHSYVNLYNLYPVPPFDWTFF